MSNSRRQFLSYASTALVTASAAGQETPSGSGTPPPGAPPAFGTAPDVGPPVSASTFAEAEKLVQFELSEPERETAAGNWRSTMAPLYERRTGPRKASLPSSLAPATRWDPVLPGQPAGPARDRFIRTSSDPGALPATDQDIAFAPLSHTCRAGSKRASSPPSGSRASIWTACSASIPSCAA